VSAAEALAGAGGSDYYLHRKTGGIYRVVANEYLRRRSAAVGDKLFPMYGTPSTWEGLFTVTDACAEDTHVTYYVNALTGARWARPSDMFYDGRFTQFERPPAVALSLALAQAIAGEGEG
jgi:hypothetical protein